MKNYSVLTISILLIVCSMSKAQGLYDAPLEEKKQLAFVPTIFIGPSIGVNNISGMMGVLLETHIFNKTAIAGGLGIGNWGAKFSVQGRYYRHYPIGVFYGIGFSSATGMKSFKTELEVENAEDPVEVEMELHKVKCLNISVGQHFKLGRRMRLNFELGYAIPLQTNFYDIITPGVQLTDASEQQMDLMTPGGLIIGVAFSIALK